MPCIVLSFLVFYIQPIDPKSLYPTSNYHIYFILCIHTSHYDPPSFDCDLHYEYLPYIYMVVLSHFVYYTAELPQDSQDSTMNCTCLGMTSYTSLHYSIYIQADISLYLTAAVWLSLSVIFMTYSVVSTSVFIAALTLVLCRKRYRTGLFISH